MIRRDTSGGRSLDDLMKWLYEGFGLTGRQLTPADIVQGLHEITGDDYRDFFDRHIAGNELLPLLEICQEAGLIVAQFQGEFYLTIDKDDTLLEDILESGL